MDNKNIIVTGATSGIGEAVALKFLAEGANIIAVGRREDKLRILKEKAGEHVICFPADLTQLENVERLYTFCKEQGVRIDGVAHCAGITLNRPLRANSIAETDDLMRINVEAMLEICRFACSKRYTNEGAALLAISSTASFRSSAGLSAYSASKAAINTLVKAAATELSQRKIRINAIAPSMVDTPMYHQTMSEIPDIERYVKSIQPFGLIEPESIADAALFLMSDKAKYITGTVLTIGAGNIV